MGREQEEQAEESLSLSPHMRNGAISFAKSNHDIHYVNVIKITLKDDCHICEKKMTVIKKKSYTALQSLPSSPA